MPSCPRCEKEVQEGWKFCRYCGHPLIDEVPEPETSLGEPISSDLLARRIDPGEMRGLLNKTVVVEEGQSAIVLIGAQARSDPRPRQTLNWKHPVIPYPRRRGGGSTDL